MALSNIFREPQREIIETMIGLVALIPLFFIDWWLSEEILYWAKCQPEEYYFPCYSFTAMMLFVTPLIVFLTIFISITICSVIHFIGEKITEYIEDYGVRLLPKRD